MKTKLLMASSFLAVAGIAVVSYATGLHSGQNYLNADQVNFKPLYSSYHQRQLKDVAMWDTMLTKISTWVENHESRLQARASSSAEYPNLSAEETSFRHLIQARENNGNRLTEQMWDSLQTQLSKVALNHEMRLRMQASQPSQPEEPGSSLKGKVQITFPQEYHLSALNSDGGFPTVRADLITNISGFAPLRYYVKDTNRFHINEDWSMLAALQRGRGELCAYTIYNGLRVEGCTIVVAKEESWVVEHPRCQVGIPFYAEIAQKGDRFTTHSNDLPSTIQFNRRYDRSIGNWFLDYVITIDSWINGRWRYFRMPDCIAESFNDSNVDSMLVDEFNGIFVDLPYVATSKDLGASRIELKQNWEYSETSSITRTGSIMRPAQ